MQAARGLARRSESAGDGDSLTCAGPELETGVVMSSTRAFGVVMPMVAGYAPVDVEVEAPGLSARASAASWAAPRVLKMTFARRPTRGPGSGETSPLGPVRA
jgi:hypothetical protein